MNVDEDATTAEDLEARACFERRRGRPYTDAQWEVAKRNIEEFLAVLKEWADKQD